MNNIEFRQPTMAVKKLDADSGERNSCASWKYTVLFAGLGGIFVAMNTEPLVT